jgi:hypothetical protein
MSPMEATVDPPSPGSRLDADHPKNGVLIPCLFTHLGSHLVEGPGQEVGSAHPGLEGPERVFDGLSSHPHGPYDSTNLKPALMRDRFVQSAASGLAKPCTAPDESQRIEGFGGAPPAELCFGDAAATPVLAGRERAGGPTSSGAQIG